MGRSRSSYGLVIMALLIVCPAAAQLRWFESYTGALADKRVKQDKKLTTTLVISEEMGRSRICVDFSNDAPKANRGRIAAVLMVFPADEDVGLVAEMRGELQDNSFFECVGIDFLIPGDVISVEVQAAKFRKMKTSGFFSTGVLVAEDALLAAPRSITGGELGLAKRQLRRIAEPDERGVARIYRRGPGSRGNNGS